MAYLKHSLNGEAAALYELSTEHEIVIGRHSDCHIVIDDPTISGHHAKIKPQAGALWLYDMGSTNGIRIGKHSVQAQQLSSGDVFVLGVHQFEFKQDPITELDQTLKIKKSWIPGVYYTEK